MLGTGPQTALLHVCLVHRLSKPAASSLLDTGGFPVSYLFSTRLLVKGVPDSTSGICPYWGKTLSVECDAVKQGWLFGGGGGGGGWAASRSVAGVQKQGCQVLLVLEDPRVWSWFSAPCVWLPGTGKEQAGETEILIAGHVAHESTQKAAPPASPATYIISFQ